MAPILALRDVSRRATSRAASPAAAAWWPRSTA